MRFLIKYFLQGLLVVVPLALTAFLLFEVFTRLDGLLPFHFPGLGLLVILVSVTVIGFVTNHLVSERLQQKLEKLLRRAPLISLVYTAVKDVLQALVGSKRSFTRPVTVQLHGQSSTRRIGFITDEDFAQLAHLPEGLITVYCPHSYNISGNLYLVEARYCQKLDLAAAEVMKYVVSAGVTQVGLLAEKPKTKGRRASAAAGRESNGEVEAKKNPTQAPNQST